MMEFSGQRFCFLKGFFPNKPTIALNPDKAMAIPASGQNPKEKGSTVSYGSGT
jgi:hypothetical protein